jgi:hypothetical protein
MTTTFTYTFNRDDIRRVYASFAADYRIVAEWTGLHTRPFCEQAIEQIKALAEEQYLKEVHIQLKTSTGRIRAAAVYRVSTNASGWSSDRPGNLYWDHGDGDRLQIFVVFSDKWRKLTEEARRRFAAVHMPDWGTSDFDGNYGPLIGSTDRRFSSGAYGMERESYS